ncbi:MAG: 3-oxoacyl-[acyl-carrier-protein] reductase [bacterium]|nr:3-oxoacyl-[acyl-carrier-protein] reductase [bacterium]
MLLKNKTAIVTGAGQGIGKTIALKLAGEGADIALCDIDEESLRKTASEIECLGRKAYAYKCNVADIASVDKTVNKILDNAGKVDILINNAGLTRDALMMRLKEEDWDLVISVNLKGVFNFMKSVCRPMLKQKSGKIVNIASIIGLIGNAGQSNYAASKAGVIALTKTAAREMASRGINVNAVAPGFIQTRMTDVLSEDVKGQMLKAIPLGYFGKPEDVANVVMFLSSELSSYVTGQVIVVDGGMVMA